MGRRDQCLVGRKDELEFVDLVLDLVLDHHKSIGVGGSRVVG